MSKFQERTHNMGPKGARRIGFIYGLYYREDRDLGVLNLKLDMVNAFDTGFREGLSLR